MKQVTTLLLVLMPLFSIGQIQTNESGFDPGGFSEKDYLFAGYNASFVIKNGTLWAWGENSSGQLGDSTLVDKLVPTRIGIDTNWKFITSSLYGNQTYALKTDGSLWVWGNMQLNPIMFGSDKWTYLSAGLRHVHGIKSDGTLWAWGDNSEKAFGDGTDISSKEPVQIGVDNTWLEISTSDRHTIARKTDGTLWGWCIKNKYNGNDKGELGLGNKKAVFTPTLLGMDLITKAVQVASCNGGSQVIDSESNRWTFGAWNLSGLKFSGGKDKYVPEKDDDDKWKNISSKFTMIIATKSDGTLWGWGYPIEDKMQLGKASDWIKISCGNQHLLALNSKGTLYTWGSNIKGQLGIGSNEKTEEFVSPFNAAQIENKNQEIAMQKLLDELIAQENAKFDSIMSKKSKWDIGGTYNLKRAEGCLKGMSSFKLTITDQSMTNAHHFYIEDMTLGRVYVDFYVDEETYESPSENQKEYLYARQTEKEGGTLYGADYGDYKLDYGIKFDFGGRLCLLQDLSIIHGVLSATVHYEEWNAEKNTWEFIDCLFSGKINL